jgi:hypothetical protein
MKPIAPHLALLAALFSTNLMHRNNAAASDVGFIQSQMRTQGTGALVQSSADKVRFYTYDQALAIIAFSHAGEFQSAKKIAQGMCNVQRTDGAWIFSYPAEPTIHDRSGAQAWMVLALNQYESLSGDKSFSKSRDQAARFLRRQIQQKDGNTVVRFSSTKDPTLSYDTTTIVSTEHMIDSIAALESLPNPLSKEDEALVKNLRRTLKAFWIGERYAAGSSLNGKLNRGEIYLDTQAWAALLPWDDSEKSRIAAGLHYNCRNFKTKYGYKESIHGSQKHDQDFAWLEGTHFMRVALQFRGEDTHQECAAEFVQANLTGKKGIPYSVGGLKHGLSESESIASTAWKFFADQNINPMQLPKKSVISSL